MMNEEKFFTIVFSVILISITILLPFRIHSKKSMNSILFSIGISILVFLPISLSIIGVEIFQNVPKTSVQWNDIWNSILRIGILSVLIGIFIGILIPFFGKRNEKK